MNRCERTRRTALVCCHCLRNVAFYRAGWRGGHIRRQHQFWISANSAFLDAAVLEWSKIFGEWNAKHHWRKLVPDEALFRTSLLLELSMSEKSFARYVACIRKYRDKFVAHLDEELVMYIPHMRIARKSVAFLFNYLRHHQTLGAYLLDAPSSAGQFYKAMYCHAYSEYRGEQ